MKKYIWILIVIAILAGGYGYYQYNRPVASLENAGADVSITAAALLNAFETDELSANNQYLDKVIEVKGEITKIEDDGSKKSVYLKTDNEMSAVICEMEEGADLNGLSEGAAMTAKGKCTGYLMDVILVQCVIKK